MGGYYRGIFHIRTPIFLDTLVMLELQTIFRCIPHYTYYTYYTYDHLKG